MYIFIYSLMVYGISNMLVYFNGPFNLVGRFRDWISDKHPTFDELFSCMFCLPTNVGILLSITALISGCPFTPFTMAFDECGVLLNLLGIGFDGAYAGTITYLIHTLQTYFEKDNE